MRIRGSQQYSLISVVPILFNVSNVLPKSGEEITDECNHRSRYKPINGANERSSRKVFHINSNLVIITAAVHSKLGLVA